MSAIENIPPSARPRASRIERSNVAQLFRRRQSNCAIDELSRLVHRQFGDIGISRNGVLPVMRGHVSADEAFRNPTPEGVYRVETPVIVVLSFSAAA